MKPSAIDALADAFAKMLWDGQPATGVRWNGGDEGERFQGLGNAQSRGILTWFVLPDPLADLVSANPTVSSPDYIGQAPGQVDGFELIGEVPQEGAIILVAIKLRVDRTGHYIVASTYPIDRNKLERRLRKGFIKPA